MSKITKRPLKDVVIKEPKHRSFFTGMLPFFVLAHCAHHLLTALPAPLLPFIQKDLELSYTKLSLVTASFALAYGFSQLPAVGSLRKAAIRADMVFSYLFGRIF